MTTIFGVYRPCNEIDSRADLISIQQSFVASQQDKAAIWQSGSVILGQQTESITSESFTANLPFHQSRSNLTIVADVRLDNRSELFESFGISLAEQENLSDAQLILTAYEKWGENCPQYLLGNFAAAIWDGNNKKLFLCRDHFGARQLFYFYDSKKFVFATNISEISAVSGVEARPNLNKLATFVLPLAKHLFWKESWFEDIFLVPAGTSLTVDPNGIKRRKYWSPTFEKEINFKSEADFAEAFQEVIFRVVADNLRGKSSVSALLSGGLDSSSIVSVAARILARQNKELQTFSSVLEDENDASLIDERFFINQFRAFPNVKINYVTAPNRGFFSDLDKLSIGWNSPLLTSRHYLYTAFAEKSQALGANVILEGAGGELGATFHGDGYYAEMFRQMRWQKLWREIRLRKKLVGESIQYNLRANVLNPLLPDFLINLRHRQKNKASAATQNHCLQKDFAEDIQKRVIFKFGDLRKLSNRILPSHRRNQLALMQKVQNKAAGGNFTQIEFRYPLMDKRLLEFCLALPGEFKVKNGFNRYPIRAGLDGILPEEIQWRNSKGAFSPDYNRRYNAQLPEAREFLENIGSSDPIRTVIDIEKIKEWTKIPVADNEHGTFAAMVALYLVPQSIYLIYFLRRFPAFQI